MKKGVYTTKRVKEITDRMNTMGDVPAHVSPWNSGIEGIRKPNLPFSPTRSEQEEYFKCSQDIEYYAEQYCKIKLEDGSTGDMRLRPYQRDMIRLVNRNRFSIMMAARQIGKCCSYNSLVEVEGVGPRKIGGLAPPISITDRIRRFLHKVLEWTDQWLVSVG